MTGLQGLRGLLVEDEAAIAMTIEDMLEDMGCIVAGSAASLGEAQRLVEKGGFDFALLDMNLGGARVEGVAETLLARGIPFAFASGYGPAGLPPHLQGALVVPKPFLISDLQQAILQSLGGTARR